MRRLLNTLAAAVAFFPAVVLAAPPTVEEMSAPMSFSFAPGGWIRAVGKIERDTPDRFTAFLTENGNTVQPGRLMQLASNGGSLDGGVYLGLRIFKAGLDTVVGGGQSMMDAPVVCASACTLAFLGGVRRHVVPRAALFMVHAHSVSKDDGNMPAEGERAFTAANLERYGRTVALTLRWATSRGVHPDWVAAMYETSNDGIRALTQEEVQNWRVDNMWPITAIKQAELLSADRLRQELCHPSLLEDTPPPNATDARR